LLLSSALILSLRSASSAATFAFSADSLSTSPLASISAFAERWSFDWRESIRDDWDSTTERASRAAETRDDAALSWEETCWKSQERRQRWKWRERHREWEVEEIARRDAREDSWEQVDEERANGTEEDEGRRGEDDGNARAGRLPETPTNDSSMLPSRGRWRSVVRRARSSLSRISLRFILSS
jgi:hypothetical protein